MSRASTDVCRKRSLRSQQSEIPHRTAPHAHCCGVHPNHRPLRASVNCTPIAPYLQLIANAPYALKCDKQPKDLVGALKYGENARVSQAQLEGIVLHEAQTAHDLGSIRVRGPRISMPWDCLRHGVADAGALIAQWSGAADKMGTNILTFQLKLSYIFFHRIWHPGHAIDTWMHSEMASNEASEPATLQMAAST